MGSVSLIDVHKRYGQGTAAAHAVRGVSADIANGEFIVIVGPSGCGKSTLLRMVAGLEEISEGEIRIDGQRVNDVEPSQRDIAMVFQNYALYPHMNVFDNMAYGLKIRGLARTDIEARVAQAARILGLEALLKRLPRQLSGGQRQRVAMGRAIVREPRVFLFDEPLSNLDAKLRVQTRLEIRRLHAQLGTTSLFVTHDQVEAMTLAQRMIVMNAGRIEQIGVPDEVYARPQTAFVAGFIGSPPMNLLPVQVDALGNVVARPGEGEPPGYQFRVRSPGPGQWLLGVRPERLHWAQQGWPVQIEFIELLGAERLVHARLGGLPIVVRCDASVDIPESACMACVTALAEDLHWFDANSGARAEPEPG
jgi:sn-glycerol 3-phosphate transport system ATP-binding protein